MPKATTKKWYAVLIGRGGPQIYEDWDACKDKVSRYPGAKHKSFKTRKEAEEWLGGSHTLESFFGANSTQAKDKSPLPLPKVEVAVPPPTTGTSKSTIVLSPEQRQVLDKVRARENIFFTGSAGTGKSVLLREIIKHCGGVGSPTVAITASTGIASVNIGGTTLHSWAGIGIGNEPAKKLIGKFWGQPKFRPLLERWQRVQTLIIDEISMLDGKLFDLLEEVARGTRQSELPFGGIQLVVCGDFCQLPPVSGRDPKGREIPAQFAFEAKCWKSCIPSSMTLTRVFRQKDQAFVDMLNEMRFGKMNPETIRMFKALSRSVKYTDSIEPTELYSTRREVDNANRSRLNNLPGESHKYSAHDIPGRDVEGKLVTKDKMDQLLDRLLCPKSVELKLGAQVMLIKNLEQGRLVNGSVGTIVRFMNVDDAEKESLKIAQTERPGNGTRDAPIDVDSLDMEDEGAIIIDDEPLVPPSTDVSPPQRQWPLVRFIGGDEKLIIPADFTVNNADGEIESKRVQVPLILAWALSVHKSQGQTLERVKVDLKRTFEKGQAYVAVSRATTMDHLQVLHFEASKVVAHPRVLQWYKQAAEVSSTPSFNDEFDEFDDIGDEMDNDEAMMAFYD